jgi:hypothetical protein
MGIPKFFFLLMLLGYIIYASGCVSQQPVNNTTPIVPSHPITTDIRSDIITIQSPADTFSPSASNEMDWIEIDPIWNFHRDFEFKNNRLEINISGKTSLPAGANLLINVYPCNCNCSNLIFDTVSVKQTAGGNNSFSYAVNVTNTIEGKRITTNEYCARVKWEKVTDIIRFNITIKEPPLWIRIDPIGDYHPGEILDITGTTNLPAGSDIIVKCVPNYRVPCPLWAKDDPSNWSGTVCGNDCNPGSFSKEIPVEQATGGNNTWRVSADMTGWCVNESYRIDVLKKKWDNESTDKKDFRIQI